MAGAWTLVCAVSAAASAEIVPYLGVMSRAVDTLVDTIMREDGIGLVVMGVDPDSPAGVVLRDVL